MTRVVLDLQDRRPVWAMPAWVPERIGAALPAGWPLTRIQATSEGTGDGAARVDPEVLAAVEDAAVYLGYGVPAELLRAGRRLRWVHSGSAGVGGSLTPEMRASPVLFTNSAGVHAPPMAETVLAMLLHFGRGLDVALRGQREGRWVAEDVYRGDGAFREFPGSTVGIVGFGGVGREVARRVAALGARVLAFRRTGPAREVVDLETVGGGARLVGAAEVLTGPAGLARLLADSDAVVLTAPGTPATRGLIDRAALARMKPGAFLVNVARGSLLDEDALVDALRSGRLGGVGLDVYATEPLPSTHPLWSLSNVLLTPHVSAVTGRFWERQTDLIVDNLGRFVRGEPLRNLVDKDAGY